MNLRVIVLVDLAEGVFVEARVRPEVSFRSDAELRPLIVSTPLRTINIDTVLVPPVVSSPSADLVFVVRIFTIDAGSVISNWQSFLI